LQSAQPKGETGVEQTKCIFSHCLNVRSNGEEVTSEGKSFQPSMHNNGQKS